MRTLSVLVLLTALSVAGAEPAPAPTILPDAGVTPTPAAVAPAETPAWLQLVILAINGLVATVLIPFLRAKQLAAAAEQAKHEQEADLAGMSKRQILSDRLKSFLLRQAGNIVERDFPGIAADVIAGKLRTAPEIKAKLYAMGIVLKQDAIKYFGNQGIDLVAAVGDEALDGLIRWAADKTSPFPGKETAVAFLEKSVSNTLIDKGVVYVRSKYLVGAEGGA